MQRFLSRLSLLLLVPGAAGYPSRSIHPLLTRRPLSESPLEPYDESLPDARGGVPTRQDVCRVFVTGVIGQAPKETYLSNDHYVINFPLAVDSLHTLISQSNS